MTSHLRGYRRRFDFMYSGTSSLTGAAAGLSPSTTISSILAAVARATGLRKAGQRSDCPKPLHSSIQPKATNSADRPRSRIVLLRCSLGAFCRKAPHYIFLTRMTARRVGPTRTPPPTAHRTVPRISRRFDL
eukprot:scaffold21636_cov60-Phaeocystis_antarctica.AAC.4